jgi:hypothetical protein
MNLNVLSAIAESDHLEFAPPELGNIGPDTGISLKHSYGIDIDSEKGYKIRNPTQRATYTRDSTYSIVLANDRASDDTDGDKLVSVSGTVTYSIATDEDGNADGESTDSLPSGSVTLK